jgi:hypothetical protein
MISALHLPQGGYLSFSDHPQGGSHLHRSAFKPDRHALRVEVRQELDRGAHTAISSRSVPGRGFRRMSGVCRYRSKRRSAGP